MWADLLGLRYRWGSTPEDGSGYTDCFALLCTMRRRMGLSDYWDRYSWVYNQYTEVTIPRGQVLRWILKHSHRCPPRPGAVSVLPADIGAIANHTEYGMLWLGPGQNVIHTPAPLQGLHSYWLE